MSTGPAVFLLLVPFVVLSLSFVWPAYLRSRVSALARAARLLPIAAVTLLVFGEFWNGWWRADGFHTGLFGVGVAAMVALHLVVFSTPVRKRLAAWVAHAHQAVREDFREPSVPPPFSRPIGSAVLFVFFCGLFYIGYTTYGAFNFELKYFVYDFIDLVQNTAREVPFLDVLTGDQCVSTRLYRTFPLSLLAVADWLTPTRYYHLCVALVGCLFVIQWSLHRRRSPWVLLGSHLFYLLVSLNPDYEYNRTGYFELAFALFYLIGFLLILHARWTARWFLVTGLATGVAFVQKELAILLAALIAYRLATSGLPIPRIRNLALWTLVGFSIPMTVFAVWLLRCGATEGVYHLPVVWYRGIMLQTHLTHLDVKTAIDQGRAFSLFEMVARRLSFQTVGEVVVGAGGSFGRYALLGVLPVVYLAANLPTAQVRVIGVYLLMGFFLYGVTHWKGGDSSDPLYTMLPFGYVFAAPYLIRLGALTVTRLRSRGRFRVRSLYPAVLMGLNVWFLAQQVPPLLHTARDLAHLDGVGREGLEFYVEPSNAEAALRDIVLHLRDQGTLGRWLFLGSCAPHEVPRSLVLSDLDRRLTLLDVRFEILDALRRQDVARLRHAFRIMTHLFSYDLQGVRRLYVLACTHGIGPDRPNQPLYSPGPWLGGCAEVLFASPKDLGVVLLSFDLERCRRYLPEDLLERRAKVEHVPRLPLTPEP